MQESLCNNPTACQIRQVSLYKCSIECPCHQRPPPLHPELVFLYRFQCPHLQSSACYKETGILWTHCHRQIRLDKRHRKLHLWTLLCQVHKLNKTCRFPYDTQVCTHTTILQWEETTVSSLLQQKTTIQTQLSTIDHIPLETHTLDLGMPILRT